MPAVESVGKKRAELEELFGNLFSGADWKAEFLVDLSEILGKDFFSEAFACAAKNPS